MAPASASSKTERLPDCRSPSTRHNNNQENPFNDLPKAFHSAVHREVLPGEDELDR
jgi:hypothetical protein